MYKKMELCKARHATPATSAIFENEIADVTDLQGMHDIVHATLQDCTKLDLYVTGLTVVLVVVINYCNGNNIPLTLWHFNRDNGEYYPQQIVNLAH